jgi:hypothetical protein
MVAKILQLGINPPEIIIIKMFWNQIVSSMQ